MPCEGERETLLIAFKVVSRQIGGAAMGTEGLVTPARVATAYRRTARWMGMPLKTGPRRHVGLPPPKGCRPRGRPGHLRRGTCRPSLSSRSVAVTAMRTGRRTPHGTERRCAAPCRPRARLRPRRRGRWRGAPRTPPPPRTPSSRSPAPPASPGPTASSPLHAHGHGGGRGAAARAQSSKTCGAHRSKGPIPAVRSDALCPARSPA